jgi:universal stress protein E
MKIERILMAVDFSETAATAVHYAANLFAPGAELILLHVVDPPRRPRFVRDKLPPQDVLEGVAREHANARLLELSSRLAPAKVRTETRIGRPHEEVVKMAAELGAGLVVIGPHGDRPRPSRFLGTTAERIARTSPAPVLVATNPPAHPPRRILVPVDDDDFAIQLLAWSDDLAERFRADVTLLHVWSNADYSDMASISYATTPTEADARKEIDKEMMGEVERWLGKIARQGIQHGRFDVKIAYGNAGDVAIETADSMNVDLIVVGRQGSGLVAPAIFGSTVGTILRGSRCPVLIVTDLSTTPQLR